MRRLSIVLLLLALAPVHAADPFAEYVRSADPKSPAEEQKVFHLPPGFEIQLVAAEPDIGKPMNLAFDSRGRLWVSETHLYPFPAKPDQPKKDAIKVIELGDDGHATSITTFADNLNIPVG